MPAGIPITLPPAVRFFAREVVQYNAAHVDGQDDEAIIVEIAQSDISALGSEQPWTDPVFKLDTQLISNNEKWDLRA